MVASDVHGKNHHVAGCFGEYVRALRMRVGDGRVLELDEATEPELFRATLGGMGLTGHIPRSGSAARRIPSFWIRGRSERVSDLDELLAVLRGRRARDRRSPPRGSTPRRAARRSARDRDERALCRRARGAVVAARAARTLRRAVRPARMVHRHVEHPRVQPPLFPRLPA
jgi:FAD/FMN-containing dehydrogenase